MKLVDTLQQHFLEVFRPLSRAAAEHEVELPQVVNDMRSQLAKCKVCVSNVHVKAMLVLLNCQPSFQRPCQAGCLTCSHMVAVASSCGAVVNKKYLNKKHTCRCWAFGAWAALARRPLLQSFQQPDAGLQGFSLLSRECAHRGDLCRRFCEAATRAFKSSHEEQYCCQQRKQRFAPAWCVHNTTRCLVTLMVLLLPHRM